MLSSAASWFVSQLFCHSSVAGIVTALNELEDIPETGCIAEHKIAVIIVRCGDRHWAIKGSFCCKVPVLYLGTYTCRCPARYLDLSCGFHRPLQVSKSTLLATSEKFCTAALNSPTRPCSMPSVSPPSGTRTKSFPFPSNGPVPSTA